MPLTGHYRRSQEKQRLSCKRPHHGTRETLALRAADVNHPGPACPPLLRESAAPNSLENSTVCAGPADRGTDSARPKVLDLFSGVGGLSLGLKWAGMETVAFCEIDPFCRRVLAKHWPGVPIFEDIRKLKGEDVGPVDVICGGYPCQPFSSAGKRGGAEDDRHLWPEMFRLIEELRPAWVIGENVAGHITLGLDGVLSDLEGAGYACRPFVIPACAVDAPHRRDRVWVVAHAARHEPGWAIERPERQRIGAGGEPQPVADAPSQQIERQGSGGLQPESAQCSGWLPEPGVGRSIDGLSAQLDEIGGLSDAAKTRSRKVLSDLWHRLDPQEVQWAVGGLEGVSETQILLAFLCEYETGKDAGRMEMERTAEARRCLRSVWRHIEFAHSPLQPRHHGQLAGEFANALRQLSCDTPSCFSAAWRNGFWEDGIASVASGIPDRVDRLRALGNAVVPQVVEEIGRAAMREIQQGRQG